MDFCIGIAGFLSKGLEDYTAVVKRIGLDKAEILFGMDNNSSPQLYSGMPERDIESAKNIFEKSGVMPYALVVPNDFTVPNWKEHLDMAKSAVDMTSVFKCPIIVMYGGAFPEFDRSKDDWNYRRMPTISNELFQRSIDCFKKLIDYTGDLPVKFAIENHDNMTFSAMQFLRFLNTVDSDKLGVTFDATNFRCMKEDPFEAYDLLKDRLFHAHLKGAHAFEDRVVLDHTMDRDDFNWLGLLKKMKQSYRGVYAIESLFPESAEESTVKNIAYFNSFEE